MTVTNGDAHRGYKSAFPVVPGPDSGCSDPGFDCAVDWPDFSDEGDPIHLDTCIVMRDGDHSCCTCGLQLLVDERAGFRFPARGAL